VQYPSLYPLAGAVCLAKRLTSIATGGETFAQARGLDRRILRRCRLSLHLVESSYEYLPCVWC